MMAQRPLVSVIVPVYNASDYLAATLRSFEGQSYGNVEWVLVDDGSTDGSAQVCAEWCAADPLHRRLFRKQNGGASSARNTGLEHAVGAIGKGFQRSTIWPCASSRRGATISQGIATPPRSCSYDSSSRHISTALSRNEGGRN